MGRHSATPQSVVSVGLFGAYDIRGRYPDEFSPPTARRIADAFLESIPGAFVVAHDGRRASRALERTVVDRLQDRDRVVVRLGIQPTPVVGYASRSLHFHGLAFTPSHNAVGYAGIKAFGLTGRSLGSEWNRIRRAFAHPAPRAKAGTRPATRRAAYAIPRVRAGKVLQGYLSHVTRGLATSRSVVLDGRGGATTLLAPRALARIGARVHELHPRFSPVFHGLSPEPLPENVVDLGRSVRTRRADLGVAFDGDGDRVTFVDEHGRWVEPEVIGAFLHRHLSPPGRPLVASVDASQRCESSAPTVRSRVGSRYVSATMRRHRSVVGFEASSHYYLDHWGPNSDGILVACVVCHLLEQERTSLGELGRAFGPIVRNRQLVSFETRAEALRTYRHLAASLGRRLEEGIDGFLFRSPHGAVHFRLSNTQPAIRVLLEVNPGHRLSDLRRVWARMAAISTRSRHRPGV